MTTTTNKVSSGYVKRGDATERRARLLNAAKLEVERLSHALAIGWDVAKDLELARASVAAFGGGK